MRYHDVFISYSRENTDILDRVFAAYRLVDFRVWTDQSIIPGHPGWQESIKDAIRNSGCVVVLLSPGAEDSKWVKREISYALRENKPIIPLLAAGNEKESMIFSLIDYQWVDIRGDKFNTGVFQSIRQIYQMFRRELLYRPLKEASELLPPTAHARSAIYRDLNYSNVVRLGIHTTYDVFFRDELDMRFGEKIGVVGDVWTHQMGHITNYRELLEDELKEVYNLTAEQIAIVKSLGCVIAVPIQDMLDENTVAVLYIDTMRTLTSLGMDSTGRARVIIDEAAHIATQLALFMAIEDNDNVLEYYVDE